MASLEDMVAAAARQGYEYYAITDHAPNLFFQRMTDEKMLAQREQVRALDAPLELLHGTELNIAPDGSVDWDEAFLAGFDLCVASVHSNFDQPRTEMTRRFVTACENPRVNIIGHPLTRRIGRRPPVDVDFGELFRACARTGTALEINASPQRLDLPSDHIRAARDAGVVFAIDSDAHSVADQGNLPYGVGTAQRGWLTPDDVINTWPLDRLRVFLRKGRRRIRTRAGGSHDCGWLRMTAIKVGYEQFIPPRVPPGMWFDPDTWLILPQGVRPASKGRVAASYALAIGLFIATLGLGYLIWAAVAWGQGQTPAQRLLGLRCWRRDTGRVAGRKHLALRQVTGLFLNGELLIGPLHLDGQQGTELGGRRLRRHREFCTTRIGSSTGEKRPAGRSIRLGGRQAAGGHMAGQAGARCAPSGAITLLASAISYALAACVQVAPGEMTLPTPCADWDLEALLAHLAASMADLESALRTGHLDPEPDDPATPDPGPMATTRSSCCATGPRTCCSRATPTTAPTGSSWSAACRCPPRS